MSPSTKAFLRTVGRLGRPLKPFLETVFQLEARVAALWAKHAHRHLFLVQWGIPPQPEHFDHQIDLYYSWLESRNPMWVERGVFGSVALGGGGGDVLELACGDGFNARNFYSIRSRRVVACDFDPRAIATARRKNRAKNVDFVLADIRSEMPTGAFQNITWDAAIEHFTPDEIEKILRDIKGRLTPDGVLSGYTLVQRSDDKKHLSHHEYEFKDKEDLLRFLQPHFRNAVVFETFSPDRHNLYFFASDGVIPFSPHWKQWVGSSA